MALHLLVAELLVSPIGQHAEGAGGRLLFQAWSWLNFHETESQTTRTRNWLLSSIRRTFVLYGSSRPG